MSARESQDPGIVLDEDNNGISGAAIEIDSKPVVFTGSDGKWSYDKATKGAKVDVKKDGYVFASGPILVESDNQTIHFLGKKGGIGTLCDKWQGCGQSRPRHT